ncbi:hypothetical protein MACH09_05790 [Vibrio sp. MACH09]|uniref:putative bifunctional diguanylate cyclase/phosphodiesterase n=1 Tax=unclassified Vibrio TaxID=2614977 RepID=UPI0014934DBB|nr:MULTISPECIES: bifunctional diguanylate cyclase/phosphodiesterase [unclassified Vibrio]NOI68757.1 bifunctional diguanylate cyclase/phosphodiesterase [Vibrio sp. 99-8-1]GLO60071.1 hypothetical protein MACH09_05790 [Vibrio sp. MACH09]
MLASFLEDMGILDCSVVQRLSEGRYKLLYANENWLYSLFPNQHLQLDQTFTFQQEPAYLVDFLYDAVEFWNQGVEGKINSGIWSEQIDNQLLRLEASAISRNGEHFLVIFNLENEYNRRQNTLQIARELLISNDTILEQHELIRSRIEELTVCNQQLSDVKLPVKDVIESADFGIAIFDKDMHAIEQNPALYYLFDAAKPKSGNPAKMLLELCRRQSPELQRVFDTSSRWSGEVYWLKPPELSRWLQVTICPVTDKDAVNYWVFLVTDVSREKYLQQSNEKLTYFDVLTGLPNRQYFWQCLQNAIELNRDFYVLQIDVKHLKRINETYGYSAGDQILKDIVARMQPILGSDNLLARIGGNEFSAIFHHDDELACALVSERLVEAVNEPFQVLSQYRCNVEINIGVAHFPLDSESAEDLMKYADLAAFTVKRESKRAVQFYSAELKEQLRQRNELEAALREAIKEQQFELYLQPVLDLETRKIVKAEALIRWLRPSYGVVSPDEFIPIAEQTGLILAIGQWVIQQASKLLAELHKQNLEIKLSVNLSPAQVSDSNLLDFIRESVQANNIDASFLELELTEGVLVDDFDKIRFFLEEVRKLGISVAIDDFGTGYSSLSYLQKLPIDHLKIDRSFIKELTGSESNRAIVLAVLAMAKGLKLGVIAEGVENEEQQHFLRENHCQAAQGYLFSRPVPFDEFRKLIYPE